MQVFERYKREVKVEKTRMVEETYTEVEQEPVMVLELTHDDVRNLSDTLHFHIRYNRVNPKPPRVSKGELLVTQIRQQWNAQKYQSQKFLDWPSV